eukprot:6490936-Amphidinium_carterae.1
MHVRPTTRPNWVEPHEHKDERTHSDSKPHAHKEIVSTRTHAHAGDTPTDHHRQHAWNRASRNGGWEAARTRNKTRPHARRLGAGDTPAEDCTSDLTSCTRVVLAAGRGKGAEGWAVSMSCWSGLRHAFPDEHHISAWRDIDARPLQDLSSVEDNGLAQ